MHYIRFVLSNKHPESGVEAGLFDLVYTLRDNPALDAQDRLTLAETLDWFEKHLPKPARFNRTRSKGYYRRATRGIAWFRETAVECIGQMHRMKSVLEAQGHEVLLICESRIGYIVYEDRFQVIAEPFAETRTGASR